MYTINSDSIPVANVISTDFSPTETTPIYQVEPEITSNIDNIMKLAHIISILAFISGLFSLFSMWYNMYFVYSMCFIIFGIVGAKLYNPWLLLLYFIYQLSVNTTRAILMGEYINDHLSDLNIPVMGIQIALIFIIYYFAYLTLKLVIMIVNLSYQEKRNLAYY